MKALLSAALCALLVATASAQTAVGPLPPDGSQVQFTDALAPGELDLYTFSIGGDVNNGDGTYLNIQTTLPAGGVDMDTEIGLYDSDGNFVATDDDGNINDPPGFVLYSLLSFGDSDPYPSDGTPGEDGTLMAGSYTLVVGGFNTEFGATLNDVIPGSSTGDYLVQFAYVPEPSALALLALGALAAIRRR